MIDPVWAWAILGIILLSIEMAIGTFDILWFGVAALCVAIALWLFPAMPSAAQYIMFAALSLMSLAIWRTHYKKTETHSRVGQSQGEEIGRTGIVIAACGPNENGKIRFTQGLMGAREWTAISNEPIAKNTEAEVITVEGNALRIKPIS
jgi:inner membrane protein